MKTSFLKRFALLAGLAAVLVSAGVSSPALPARAEDNINHGRMVTVNPTHYRVWITTYNFARHQINYGWLHAGETVTYGNCCYVAGSHYYVRAEVKKSSTDATNIADTTIHVIPRLCKQKTQLGDGAYYGYARVVLRHSGGNHFYWDRDDKTFGGSNGVPECSPN